VEVFFCGLGKREKGKQIYISLTGNPLFPHPLSLTIKTFLGEAEYENKTAVRRFYFFFHLAVEVLFRGLGSREKGKGETNLYLSYGKSPLPSSLIPND